MGHLTDKEAHNCSKRSDAHTAALRSYYAQNGVSAYNLDEPLEALLTLNGRSKRSCIPDCQKRYVKLSRTPILSLFVSLGDGIIPLTMTKQTVFSDNPSEGNSDKGPSERSHQEESNPEETETQIQRQALTPPYRSKLGLEAKFRQNLNTPKLNIDMYVEMCKLRITLYK